MALDFKERLTLCEGITNPFAERAHQAATPALLPPPTSTG
jgi:hypothetical protein